MRPIYYDTETTGTRIESDHIIEIAAFDPVLDKTFCSFVKPPTPIPPEATSIHNITDEMVASSPSFAIVGKQFCGFCQGDVVLIAHNNDGFDKPFLESQFARASLELPSWKYIDTLKWARRYRPDLPRHSLQYLRQAYQLDANNAHRALDDVIILHQVFTLMIDDLPIDKVFSLLEESKSISRMPFGKHQGKPLDQVPKSYISWLAESGAFDKAQNKELKESFEELGVL